MDRRSRAAYADRIAGGESGRFDRVELERVTKPLRQQNGLALLASADGRDGSIAIRQDAEIHFGHLETGASLELDHQHSWLHLIAGEVRAGTTTLTEES